MKSEYINFCCGLRTHTLIMKYSDYFRIARPNILFCSKGKGELKKNDGKYEALEF